MEILGRKLGDIGQTFVNLYDLLEVGLTEAAPKKNRKQITKQYETYKNYLIRGDGSDGGAFRFLLRFAEGGACNSL